MIEIRLTQEQWTYAASKGMERQIDAIMKDRDPGHGITKAESIREGWLRNPAGASGERVVSKWTGIPWDGAFGNLKADDVGPLQVRTTPGHDYPLRIEKHDPDDKVFVHVTGTGPIWRIQGFILGGRGKRKEWWGDAPPPYGKPNGRYAYWVPQNELRRTDEDLAKLKARVRAAYIRGDFG